MKGIARTPAPPRCVGFGFAFGEGDLAMIGSMQKIAAALASAAGRIRLTSRFAVSDTISRVAGSPGRRVAGSPGRRVAGSPGRRVAGSPGRRVAGSPGRRVAGSPGRPCCVRVTAMSACAWLRRSRRPSSPPESLSSAGRHSASRRPASSSDSSGPASAQRALAACASGATRRLRHGLRPVLASALLSLPLLAGLPTGAQGKRWGWPTYLIYRE